MSNQEQKLIEITINEARKRVTIPEFTIPIRDFEGLEPGKFCFYDSNYPCREFRISCQSVTKINDTDQYIGIIVYSIGTYNARERTGHNIHPGWMLIKKADEVPSQQQIDEQEIHDRLARSHF